MIDKLNEWELEEVDVLKDKIKNLSDYRQVEMLYDYCFDLLNESGIYEFKESSN